jgi:hypothetical protein
VPALATVPGTGPGVQELARSGLPLGTFPNPAQGWGRINVSAVLPFDGRGGLWFADEGPALDTGQAWNATLHVAAGAPLRVVLAWTDAAGAAGADPALVDDLDLTVTGPDGIAYQGNLWLQDASEPVPLYDHVNNAEGVELAAPEAGDWRITVTASDVPAGAQTFAVVATGAVG